MGGRALSNPNELSVYMNTTPSRATCEAKQWLHKGEVPILTRFIYPVQDPPARWEGNSNAIDRFIDDLISSRLKLEPLDDPLSNGCKQDVLIAEVDRYGIPGRTVLNLSSGLIRSDPYLREHDLEQFYSRNYRDIYIWKDYSIEKMRDDQLRHGEKILSFIGPYFDKPGKVLDVGCGLGATLIPFKESGWTSTGIDYGEDLLERGRMEGLDLRRGGIAELDKEFDCDLILLSHVLEHQRNPLGFLAQFANRWPDALIYIEVPGLFHLHQGYKWDILMYLQNAHAFYFTADSLIKLAASSGLKLIQCDESIRSLFRVGETKIPLDGRPGKRAIRYLKRVEFIRKFTALRKLVKKLGWLDKLLTS